MLEVCSLVTKYKKRIGRWWSTQAVLSACCRQNNKCIIVAALNCKIVGCIILQKWGKKGEWKGHCKSLVTISEKPGVATILQSILPNGTIGYVSERNIKQNKVMIKAGYKIIDTTGIDPKLKRRMIIWKGPAPKKSLKSVQKKLTEKLLSMES
jgi:hypothetical protein